MDISYINTSVLKFNARADDPGFGADVVIIDLEDAVHQRQKDDARRTLATLDFKALRARGLRCGIRINSLMSAAGLRDLCALGDILRDAPDSVVFVQLPKVESAFEVRQCRVILGEMGLALKIVPIIETPKGVDNLEGIAPLSDAMMFGRIDMNAALYRSNGTYLAYARGRFCAACAEHGISAIDTANFGSGADISDLAAFEQDCLAGRAEGFTARAVVHPAQVAIVRRVFAISEDELQAWRRTIAAYDDAQTGFSIVEGGIVAPPFVAHAKKMLRLYRDRWGEQPCLSR